VRRRDRYFRAVSDGKITEVKFDGRGCAICTASASIMTQKLIGKTQPEARQFIGGFLNMMRGETAFRRQGTGRLESPGRRPEVSLFA
jgi:nitrogen fixation protein NifU and related proteins